MSIGLLIFGGSHGNSRSVHGILPFRTFLARQDYTRVCRPHIHHDRCSTSHTLPLADIKDSKDKKKAEQHQTCLNHMPKSHWITLEAQLYFYSFIYIYLFIYLFIYSFITTLFAYNWRNKSTNANRVPTGKSLIFI